MQTFVIILTVIIAILLIAVVLVQKSKGGGLASNFAGSNQIMGVRRTNDFIEKATWTLACAVAILSIIAVFLSPASKETGSMINAPVAPETEAPLFPVSGNEETLPAPIEELPAQAQDVPAPVEAPAAD